jgi:phenylacetate-CoA ligase
VSRDPVQVNVGAERCAAERPYQRENKKLRRLVQVAWRYVPFYSRHWRSVGARLAAMTFPRQLSELPVVRKSDLLVEKAVDLIDSRYSEGSLIVEKTSGSSGQPMQIHKDSGTARRRGLRFLRALLRCGYRPGQKLLVISTRRSGGLMGLARWQYVDLRDQDLLAEYQRARPTVLYGPLSSLLQICDYAQRKGMQLFQPSMLISTAEQLMPLQRAQLEKSFRCPVADFYGMTEVGLVAFRRPSAQNYEVASVNLILEYLPTRDGTGAERLIVTDVTGGARPVIRYDTGDLVYREAQNHASGIRQFAGRNVDRITLLSGETISPYRVTLCLEELPDVRGYQVVQRRDLSLDVYFNSDDQHTDRVRQDISTALAPLCGELPLRIHYQQQATHQVAGKFRPVQSELRPSD